MKIFSELTLNNKRNQRKLTKSNRVYFGQGFPTEAILVNWGGGIFSKGAKKRGAVIRL